MKDSVHILNTENTIANQYLAELRDITIQKDRMRFRRNLERMGECMGYEISKRLEYKSEKITTPLGEVDIPLLVDQPVLITIFRAGLPMHQGLMNIFDRADSGFVSAIRHVSKIGEMDVKMEYFTTPDLTGKTVIVSDPMMASGQSMVTVCKEIVRRFDIKHLHIVSAIGCVEGLTYVRSHLPNATIWLGALDSELTTKSYIVPGLGDAGDLCFGDKV
jgi:uracil phosphoribosyltransferase